MTPQEAEIIGLLALAHMAKYEEILTTYIQLSGITPEGLKESAADPATLGSILDYFLQNEKRLLDFCRLENIAPIQLNLARQQLPGGEKVPYST